MMKRVCQLSVLVFILAAPAMAQSDRGGRGDRVGPGWFARRCIGVIHRMSERTVYRIGNRTHACIREVNALLEEGTLEEARAVADRCIDSIERTAQGVSNRIEQLATRCVAMLQERETPEEVIAAVRQVAREGMSAVRSAADRAVQAIRDLFTI